MAAMGHEKRFPPSRLSAGFGLRKETIAGRRAMGETRRQRPFQSIPGRRGHSGRISSLANQRTPLRALVGSSDAIDLRV